MNGESYKSLYSTTMSFGPKYDGSDVLYWDGKVRPLSSDYGQSLERIVPYRVEPNVQPRHFARYGDEQ